MEKITVEINGVVFKDDEITDCLIGWDNGVMRVLINTTKPVHTPDEVPAPAEPEETVQTATVEEDPTLPSKEPYVEPVIEGSYKLAEDQYDRLVALSVLRGREDKDGKEGEKAGFKIISGEYNINDFTALDAAVDDIVAHEAILFTNGYFFHKESEYPKLVFEEGDQENFHLQEQIVVTLKKVKE